MFQNRQHRPTFDKIDHVKAKFYRTFNCIYAKSFAANSELTTVTKLHGMVTVAGYGDRILRQLLPRLLVEPWQLRELTQR